MRFLLDTHVFLWIVDRPEMLSPSTLSELQNPANELYLSAASSWEIAVKHSVGKITLPMSPGSYVESRRKRIGAIPLAITFDHAASTVDLPNIHRDPFDRMLIAQSIFERLTLVSADEKIAKYPIALLKARSKN